MEAMTEFCFGLQPIPLIDKTKNLMENIFYIIAPLPNNRAQRPVAGRLEFVQKLGKLQPVT